VPCLVAAPSYSQPTEQPISMARVGRGLGCTTRWSELSDPTGMPPACHLMVMFLGRAKDLTTPEHPGGTAALDRWLSPSATHACRVVGAAQLQQDMPPWLWRVLRVWRAFLHMAGVACIPTYLHTYLHTAGEWRMPGPCRSWWKPGQSLSQDTKRYSPLLCCCRKFRSWRT